MSTLESKRHSGVRRVGRPLTAAATALSHRADRAVGGRGRVRVILLLAMVTALDGADKATVSVNADSLEQGFGIGHTAIGLLVSATSLAGAVATVPAGVLTDRVSRTRLLGISVVLWGVAMVAAAVAPSYAVLLAARVALGVVTATAGPAVASLVGDFFPAHERARLYGYILAGELCGTGFGYVVSANLSELLSWRVSFGWLALPGWLLAWRLLRLPDPPRGGGDGDGQGEAQAPAPSTRRVVRAARSEPRPEAVLREDPRQMSAWRAYRYVLGIRTVVLMIAASALGYFFFAGIRTFGLLFVTDHYGVSKSVAGGLTVVIGAGILAGLLAGARLPDVALRRGHAGGRVLVPAVALLAAGPVMAPAFMTTSTLLAVPLLAVGAGLLAAANPPLDAARLDIVPPLLWGRSEAARTLVRSAAESSAPLLFGFLASQVFASHGQAGGLQAAFLVFLIPLPAAGLLCLLALRTYPRDVATALESAAQSGHQDRPERAAPGGRQGS